MITVHVPRPVSGHRVLGVDPSLASTGAAALDESGNLIGAWRIVPDDKAGSVHERACSIAWQVAELMPIVRPSFVFIEKAIHVMSKGTGVTMGVLSGAIGMAVHVQSSRKLHVNCFDVNEWRKLLGIKKRKKDEVIPEIVWLLRERGIPFADYCADEIEAVGIAEAGRLELARLDP